MAKSGLSFRVSSALKDIIGRDLITDDYIAIFELVKNSYDAHAKRVDVIFENIYDAQNSKIIIKDNGKGMDYNDLKDKWLFVAYSAKKEGSEDSDYRDKIYQNRIFTGAKGIGRFSCDRLGKNLKLESTKKGGSRTEILYTNWEEFEKNMREEFVEIPVDHSYKLQNSYGLKHGTVLEISGLRNLWDKSRIDKLIGSLAKLINPSTHGRGKDFNIFISCIDEGLHEVKIENFIFETLEIKTSTIIVDIPSDGSHIITELKDGGTRIYKIKEINPYKSLLKDISVKLFYLNKGAKLTFSHRMGMSTRDYGSIFLYKNDVRIYPYGEPGEDPLKLDSRKAQKPSIYIGNKDLIGRIEILGSNEEFKETSSRGDGFIKNNTYDYFLTFLYEKVISRLERYVIDVQKWGDGSFLSIEDSLDNSSKAELKTKITALISRLTNTDNIIDLEYEDDFINLYTESQSESAISLVKNLFRLAKNSGNQKLLDAANRTEARVAELYNAYQEANKAADDAVKNLAEKESENLFLKAIKSQDLDEVVSFLHHIGISSGIIDNYLTGLFNRVKDGVMVPQEQLLEILNIVVFENKKIQNISKFATKANFKLYTDAIELNFNEYLREYIGNIVALVTNEGVSIKFIDKSSKPIVMKFRPIELNILVDNLLSNSKKANATIFKITLESIGNQTEVSFSDNGKGIPPNKLSQIFEYGFTTTSEGSGIGLFHVSEIVKRMRGQLKVESTVNKGTTFKIIL